MTRLIPILFFASFTAGCLAPPPEEPIMVEPEPAANTDIASILACNPETGVGCSE